MAKQGRTMQEFATEVVRQHAFVRDFKLGAGNLEMTVGRTLRPVVADDGTEKQEIVVSPLLGLLNKPVGEIGPRGAAARQERDVFGNFEVGEVAIEQLAEYTKIPLSYFKRMAVEDPTLLAQNVNRWLEDKAADENRMIRTLDGRVRAVLSTKYRALDNRDLVEAIIPLLMQRNMMIISQELTERRLYIKAVDKSITADVPTGRRIGDGSHVFFDTCSPAIIISNSDVGCGGLNVETAIFTSMCTNLATMGAAIKRRHVGKRHEVLGDGVEELLSDDTRKLQDQALWSSIKDVISGALDEAKFKAECQLLGKAAEDKIDDSAGGSGIIEVTKRTCKHFGLLEGETDGVLGALMRDGDLTRYGIHSAITNYSQHEKVSYDRATELERAGGALINLPARDWKRLNQAEAA